MKISNKKEIQQKRQIFNLIFCQKKDYKGATIKRFKYFLFGSEFKK